MIHVSEIGFQIQPCGVKSMYVESGASDRFRGILLRAVVLHRVDNYFSFSVHVSDEV